MPPFAQPGIKIDATVAAMGDAANLQGGILIIFGNSGKCDPRETGAAA